MAASEYSLKQWGIARGELELLLNANYVTRASAHDLGTNPCRQGIGYPKLCESFFIITPSGTAFLEQIVTAVGVNLQGMVGGGSQEREVPQWDGRKLCFHAVVVKQFKRSAPNQECLLNAFEERRWPIQIDDPLPHINDLSPADRLHDAMKRLNRSLDVPLLHFGGNGKGTGVCWRAVPPPRQDGF